MVEYKLYKKNILINLKEVMGDKFIDCSIKKYNNFLMMIYYKDQIICEYDLNIIKKMTIKSMHSDIPRIVMKYSLIANELRLLNKNTIKCSNNLCNKILDEDDINAGGINSMCFKCGERYMEAQQDHAFDNREEEE